MQLKDKRPLLRGLVLNRPGDQYPLNGLKPRGVQAVSKGVQAPPGHENRAVSCTKAILARCPR